MNDLNRNALTATSFDKLTESDWSAYAGAEDNDLIAHYGDWTFLVTDPTQELVNLHVDNGDNGWMLSPITALAADVILKLLCAFDTIDGSVLTDMGFESIF